MNANLTLDDMRRIIVSLADEPTPGSVRLVVQTFEALDAHLSAGGTPPEAWREGPDAPTTDADPAVYSMDLDDTNLHDLAKWVDRSVLVGIVDEDEGIVAYCHRAKAVEITRALQAAR